MSRAAKRLAIANLQNLGPLESESDDGEHSDAGSDSLSDPSTEEISGASSEDEEVSIGCDESTSNDGTKWIRLRQWQQAGRVMNQNIFRGRPGVKPFYKRSIDSPLASWNILFRPQMLDHILESSNAKVAQLNEAESDINPLTMSELKCFIGLLYLRGVLGWRRTSLNDIWSTKFGGEFFRAHMSRRRFSQCMRCMRFDNINNRRAIAVGDQFQQLRHIHDLFNIHCVQAYTPHPSLTIDEQLLPLKNRCRFIQFMPQKPDKFGVKFWVLVDCTTKFCCQYIPYLGRQGTAERGATPLGEYVVKTLLLPSYLNKSYNVTTDNFFTTAPLAKYLWCKQTTIVGTVRSSSRSLIPAMRTKDAVYSSQFFKSDNILCVAYQAKPQKKVVLISTMHNSPVVAQEEKRKPEIVQYYNTNKVGVDCLDSMLRLYSTKSATRRWPMGCFFDLLDKAALNSWIMFVDATGVSLSRREYIMQLAEQLCGAAEHQLAPNTTSSLEQRPPQKRRKCSITSCENKTAATCVRCRKPCCGRHGQNKVTCVNCQ
jgi:hypothetical protein